VIRQGAPQIPHCSSDPNHTLIDRLSTHLVFPSHPQALRPFPHTPSPFIMHDSKDDTKVDAQHIEHEEMAHVAPATATQSDAEKRLIRKVSIARLWPGSNSFLDPLWGW
jgi:hypothetical protein